MVAIVFPMLQPRLAARMKGLTQELFGLWPMFAFFFSFALIATRGATPFVAQRRSCTSSSELYP
jgi:hypothetical protein